MFALLLTIHSLYEINTLCNSGLMSMNMNNQNKKQVKDACIIQIKLSDFNIINLTPLKLHSLGKKR